VLPRNHRVTAPSDFRAVMRAGRRAGRTHVVVHVLVPRTDQESTRDPRVGFVVSKKVGNSVLRHRTVRRLRHVMAARLASLPGGSSVVVRAREGAADVESARLAAEIDSALAQLLAPRTAAGSRA
jgi:ribonuclease P protein component